MTLDRLPWTISCRLGGLLWKQLGMSYPSALGWAVEIERAAEVADRPAMEMFFDMLDEFRADGTRSPRQPPP